MSTVQQYLEKMSPSLPRPTLPQPTPNRAHRSGFWRCSWDRRARRHTTTPTSPWTICRSKTFTSGRHRWRVMLQKSATIPSERTRHQNGNSKEPSRAGLLHAKRMPCEQNFNRLSSKSHENAAASKLHDEKDKAQYARRSNGSGWTPLQQSQTGAFLTSSNAMATSGPNR